MNKDVECPYCEKWQEICHDDGFGYAEDEAHETQCNDCEKYFVFHTSISFDYEGGKADCLNGAEHAWKKSYIAPDYWPDARHCSDCEKRERGKMLDKEGQKKVDEALHKRVMENTISKL